MRLRTLALLAALVPLSTSALAGETAPLLHTHWSFDGIFGTYDKAAAQRGFLIYSQVCSACHSMKYMDYRNLAGIGLDEAQIKAVAAAVTVPGGVNDQGTPIERPGLPSDAFKAPFANEQAARAAMGGALPPDQSLLVSAREGGPTYIYSLMQGYRDPPPNVKMQSGLYYNIYFPGNQIAMPPPLTDDAVTYTDGTKATLAQEAHDVATFLTYTSYPNLDQQHRLGVKVFLFLLFMSVITYIAKRRIWANVH
jgi:ubiquinol-cytochrome c reductase cytochrome c1 subunit